VSEAAFPRRGRKTKEKHNIEDRGYVDKKTGVSREQDRQ